jgi:hypothetical protein
VIISGVLSAGSAPAETLRALERGEFELIASEALLLDLGGSIPVFSPREFLALLAVS